MYMSSALFLTQPSIRIRQVFNRMSLPGIFNMIMSASNLLLLACAIAESFCC